MKEYKFTYILNGISYSEQCYESCLETLIASRDKLSEDYGVPKSEIPVFARESDTEEWHRL